MDGDPSQEDRIRLIGRLFFQLSGLRLNLRSMRYAKVFSFMQDLVCFDRIPWANKWAIGQNRGQNLSVARDIFTTWSSPAQIACPASIWRRFFMECLPKTLITQSLPSVAAYPATQQSVAQIANGKMDRTNWTIWVLRVDRVLKVIWVKPLQLVGIRDTPLALSQTSCISIDGC